jgi:isoleucyl-tRNA synthetase
MILDAFAPETAEDGTWDGEYVRAHLAEMPEEDRWIISRVNTLAAEVGDEIEDGMLHRATRACLTCILEDVSRWYVQLVRPRMWLEEDAREKREAYETMYYVMRRICSVLAPFAPHITENIYTNLRTEADPESIHMLPWFAGEESLVDADLEAAMDVIRSFDEASATARQEGGRKLRWPIGEAFVLTESDAVATAITAMNDLACQRANSRAVTVVRGAWDRMGWAAEPVMRGIGPDFGKEGPKVKAAIEAADAAALKTALAADGEVTVGDYTITEKHIAFSEKLPENVFAAEMKDATVCVDITLTPALEGVGFAREVVRRIQEMRRQLDLNVEDFITADVAIADERVRDLLTSAHEDVIAGEVRATTLTIAPAVGEHGDDGLSTDWDVEGVSMTIHIQKNGNE